MEEIESGEWFSQGGKEVFMMCENEGGVMGLYRSGERGSVCVLGVRFGRERM